MTGGFTPGTALIFQHFALNSAAGFSDTRTSSRSVSGRTPLLLRRLATLPATGQTDLVRLRSTWLCEIPCQRFLTGPSPPWHDGRSRSSQDGGLTARARAQLERPTITSSGPVQNPTVAGFISSAPVQNPTIAGLISSRVAHASFRSSDETCRHVFGESNEAAKLFCS
jgi:hypothetical protein